MRTLIIAIIVAASLTAVEREFMYRAQVAHLQAELAERDARLEALAPIEQAMQRGQVIKTKLFSYFE